MDTRNTTITQLADFINRTRFENLPTEVVIESKRLIFDSVGCALAGTCTDKGKWGWEFARQSFTAPAEATVIGFGGKLSMLGASFVNGELINAMDYDAVVPPGHVAPLVIPAILAMAEKEEVSGKELITACALAHEISNRIGSALPYYRNIVDGEVRWPAVSGFSCCIFGGTAGVCKVKGFPREMLSNALGIAAYVAPMQTLTSWVRSGKSTTIKYVLAGWISQAEITASCLAELGHRGDSSVLDGDYGFLCYASGSPSNDIATIVDELGKTWKFPSVTCYKPYPACRGINGVLECLSHIVEKENLHPDEIESVRAYLETIIASGPIYQNRNIENQCDAQMSIAYLISVVAHRIKPGVRWHDWDTIRNPKILKFMDKVSYHSHPGYIKALCNDPRSRLSRIEVSARGENFTFEIRYPKGSPSPDVGSYMTDEELVNKFKDNAITILPANRIDAAVNGLLELEKVDNIRKVAKLVSL